MFELDKLTGITLDKRTMNEMKKILRHVHDHLNTLLDELEQMYQDLRMIKSQTKVSSGEFTVTLVQTVELFH